MTTALISKLSTPATPARLEASSNPRFQPIVNAAQFPLHVVTCCLSYLSTTFDIVELIGFARGGNFEVHLLPKESFRIRDLSYLFQLQKQNPEQQPRKKDQQLRFMIDKVLSLAAKKIEIAGTIDLENSKIGSAELALQAASQVTLKFTNAPVISVFPPHFFHMMAKFMVPAVRVEPLQQLQFIGTTGDEDDDQAISLGDLDPWKRRLPEGYDWRFSYENEVDMGKLRSGWLVYHYDIPQQQRQLIWRHEHGMTFRLFRTFSMALAQPVSSGQTSLVRVIEDTQLTEDFSFNDRNAIVIVERNLTAEGKRVHIVAKNFIIVPGVQFRAGEVQIETEGDVVVGGALRTKGDCTIRSGRDVTVGWDLPSLQRIVQADAHRLFERGNIAMLPAPSKDSSDQSTAVVLKK